MATYTAPAGTTLTFENGPSQTVQLQWGTYYDAADQAGLSRLWGGIHVPVDDLTGRRVGAQCGQGAWALARKYFDGSVVNAPLNLTIRAANSTTAELRFDTRRGIYYKLQSTPSLVQPFTDEPGGFVQALDSPTFHSETLTGSQKFFRVINRLAP